MIERSDRTNDVPPPNMLPSRQRVILEVIREYCAATGEGCSASYLARRLRVDHSTVREHLEALHRKGWLRAPNSPALPRQR